MIDYDRLQGLFKGGSYDQLRSSHKGWIEEYLANGLKGRQEEWTDSIGVGSKSFIEQVKEILGLKAKGREITEGDEGYHLREEAAHYMIVFRAEKEDIGPENTYFWEINSE